VFQTGAAEGNEKWGVKERVIMASAGARAYNGGLGADVYPHMPILRTASTLDQSASAQATSMIKPPYKLHTHMYPILGFLESKVPQIERLPAQDANEPPCKIWCC